MRRRRNILLADAVAAHVAEGAASENAGGKNVFCLALTKDEWESNGKKSGNGGMENIPEKKHRAIYCFKEIKEIFL